MEGQQKEKTQNYVYFLYNDIRALSTHSLMAHANNIEYWHIDNLNEIPPTFTMYRPTTLMRTKPTRP